MSHFEHTVKTKKGKGFTYKFLPKDPTHDEDLKHILDEAINYTKVKGIIITDSHYNHLKKSINLTPIPECDNSYYFYLDNAECRAWILPRKNDDYLIVFFINKHSPEKKLFKQLKRGFMGDALTFDGLHSILDPNQGGSIEPEYLQIFHELEG